MHPRNYILTNQRKYNAEKLAPMNFNDSTVEHTFSPTKISLSKFYFIYLEILFKNIKFCQPKLLKNKKISSNYGTIT